MKKQKSIPGAPRMKRIVGRLLERWGEPSHLLVLDGGPLPFVQVAVWDADEACDVTSFNTLGASARKMPQADYFVEFHLAIRSALDAGQRQELAAFLAELATYPFQEGCRLDWGERVVDIGQIPQFSGCRDVFLMPSLVEQGLQTIADPDGLVKLLYVVPITPFENHLLKVHGIEAFEAHLEEQDIDILADRHGEYQALA